MNVLMLVNAQDYSFTMEGFTCLPGRFKTGVVMMIDLSLAVSSGGSAKGKSVRTVTIHASK